MGSVKSVLKVMLAAIVAVGLVSVTANASTTVYNNGTGSNGGYYYSLYSSGGSAQMTVSGGNYSLSFSGVNDVVGGTGWNPGSTHTVGYNVGYASNYNNISIYAWFTNPLTETYICEFGNVASGSNKGSFSSDGHNYTTWEHQQVNQPSIQGTATFEQYLDQWGGSSTGSNHTVTVNNHVNHWRQVGLPIGNWNYQILATEAWGGRSGGSNATVW